MSPSDKWEKVAKVMPPVPVEYGAPEKRDGAVQVEQRSLPFLSAAGLKDRMSQMASLLSQSKILTWVNS